MVHVSEYKIRKPPREKEKSNIVLRVVCVKCGKRVDQDDVGVFMQEFTCDECVADRDYNRFRGRLKR